jgi:fused signal recognition particle receptor
VTIAIGVAVATLLLIIAVWIVVRYRRGAVVVPGDSPPESDLGTGLAPTRRILSDRLRSLFGAGFDPGGMDELEETLLAADIGVSATSEIIGAVRDRRPAGSDEARTALRNLLVGSFGDVPREVRLVGEPAVVVVVGVNGSGKTTTAAKLGARLDAAGVPVLLGAADTFRAAAADQLRTWADRLGLDVVSGEPGADPASVAFDAYRAAAARGKGAVVVDTAGRLHSKKNLMDELGKVVRVLEREAGGVGEVLLVLDGTTGQNGIGQVKAFTEAVGVTGLVVTKLDGTARGGIAVAVERELGVPLKFIGVGEGPHDLLAFEPRAFVDALLGDVDDD